MYKITILLLCLVCPTMPLLEQEQPVYLKAGLLYDSKQNLLLEDRAIHVQGNEIVDIADFSSIPPNAKTIDLSGYTVLPGLIDAHTHVLFSQEAQEDFAAHSIKILTTQSDALRALRGAKRAKSYLEVGITSIKDLGNSGPYLDVALRDAIAEGTVEGPRVFASGSILAAEGGQIYGVTPGHQELIGMEYRIIKGVEDARNAVREHVNQAVDLIKICADNLPNQTFLSIAEMESIVDAAHSYGLTVTAHAVTNQSAWNAVQAGVDGIEHGFNLADSTLSLMAEKKVFLVPTENSRKYMETYTELAGYAENETAWIDIYMQKSQERLLRAIKKGVPVIAGSDNYTKIGVSAGQSSKDMLRTYFEAGMEPLDILHAATYLSAFHMNKENEIGVLAPGAKADIIAVEGNIKADFIQTMQAPKFVMKDGKVYIGKD